VGRLLGGFDFDGRIRNLWWKISRSRRVKTRRHKRAMAKLMKKAPGSSSASANAEAVVAVRACHCSAPRDLLLISSILLAQIESLTPTHDFRTRLTRTAFESAISDLQARFAQPINDALQKAGMSINDVTSVVLLVEFEVPSFRLL